MSNSRLTVGELKKMLETASEEDLKEPIDIGIFQKFDGVTLDEEEEILIKSDAIIIGHGYLQIFNKGKEKGLGVFFEKI